MHCYIVRYSNHPSLLHNYTPDVRKSFFVLWLPSDNPSWFVIRSLRFMTINVPKGCPSNGRDLTRRERKVETRVPIVFVNLL